MNRHWYTTGINRRRTWLDRHGSVIGAGIIVASSMVVGAALAWWWLL